MYRSAGKEKESRCLVFTFSTKRETRHFHVVVVKWRQRNVPRKRDALAKLLFGQFKPIAFLPFSLTSPSSLLPIHLSGSSLLLILKKTNHCIFRRNAFYMQFRYKFELGMVFIDVIRLQRRAAATFSWLILIDSYERASVMTDISVENSSSPTC